MITIITIMMMMIMMILMILMIMIMIIIIGWIRRWVRRPLENVLAGGAPPSSSLCVNIVLERNIVAATAEKHQQQKDT
ncbi:hypothetical protein M0802_002095 [Mischocyttarus mexicanus]|nr:hypothetical protein M0802_002095 [Mischocyttarus mexicanus]